MIADKVSLTIMSYREFIHSNPPPVPCHSLGHFAGALKSNDPRWLARPECAQAACANGICSGGRFPAKLCQTAKLATTGRYAFGPLAFPGGHLDVQGSYTLYGPAQTPGTPQIGRKRWPRTPVGLQARGGGSTERPDAKL